MALRLLDPTPVRLVGWLVLLTRLGRRQGRGDPGAASSTRGAAPSGRPVLGHRGPTRAVISALARLLPQARRVGPSYDLNVAGAGTRTLVKRHWTDKRKAPGGLPADHRR